MRSFEDARGRLWDVAIDRESWGTFVLIFSIRGGRDLRRFMLHSSTAADAHRELDHLADEELRQRLALAEPLM